MRDVDPIIINSLDAFLEMLEQFEVWVEWRVRCDIGPGWMEGGRLIQSYVDHRPLADTLFRSQLEGALIQSLNIPETSPDAVISGEGDIKQRGNTLEIEYEWYEAVPYMNSRDSGFGKATLVDLSSPFVNSNT